jgi:hypothetical protein
MPDFSVVRKHIAWALTSVSQQVNVALAEEQDPRELVNLERYLRDSLATVARLEEVE